MSCIIRKHIMMIRPRLHIHPLLSTISGKSYHRNAYNDKLDHKYDQGSLTSGHKHAYLNMYPWKSFQNFVDTLYNSILYEDEHIVALEKPWGVGTWQSSLSVHKTNAHLLQMEYFGNPHFCVADALPELELRLRTPSLKVVKAVDRFQSGVILLCKNTLGSEKVKKSFRRARAFAQPFMTFWCLCRGYPIASKSDQKIERVAIKLLEVDEFGDYKEPVIVTDFTRNQMKSDEFKIIHTECHVLESNPKLSASLIQITCDSQKWKFVQTYAAFRTSFVLGDTRFSRRVSQLLGNPITLVPQKINHTTGYTDHEPLQMAVRRKLRIARNSEIPLMIHHKKILLPYYKSVKDKESLVIESKRLPPHFEWTAKSLNLLSFNPEFR